MTDKKKILSGPFLWVVLFITAFLGEACAERLAIEGSYQTVTESEWNVTLNLKKGGVAEIIKETWNPGEPDKRSGEKIPGRWSARRNIVMLEYNGITDTLVFDEKLSIQSLGLKGGWPGLIQIRAFDDRSLISFYPLWKLPHQFEK